jgi:hypothetical protein
MSTVVASCDVINRRVLAGLDFVLIADKSRDSNDGLITGGSRKRAKDTGGSTSDTEDFDTARLVTQAE